MDKQIKFKIIFVLLGLAAIDFLVWHSIILIPRYSELDFLNVGQGDASLLKFFNSGTVLIDAGPDQSILNGLGQSLSFFGKELDILILSHANLDHYAGFFDVLKHYQPRVFVYNGFDGQSATFNNLLQILKEKGVIIFKMAAGDKIKSGQSVLEILSPNAQSMPKDVNDASLVFRLSVNNFKTLFLGDTSSRVLGGLDADLRSDIVKISHHGSKTGTSKNILDLVQAKIALIGAGKDNRFNHPAQEIIALLKQSGIDIFRTDEDGNIRIIFGSQLELMKNY
ncbi:MAG: MBL fold metallo-hydrolase [bacterium]|nr:MBL fold metallo-hydrolase [bacterium]